MDPNIFLCGVNRDRLKNLNVLNKLRRARESIRERDREKLERPGRRHLPVGSGDYTVGVVDIMSGHTINGTFIRLYYPTYQTDIYKREAQWPLWLPRKQYGKGYVYFRRRNTKVFGTILNWVGGDVYVPALWQAPVLQGGTKFPLLIFSHGLGGNRTTYTTVCTDLASHGFVVAAIEHRDGSASMTYCFQEPLNKASNNNTEEPASEFQLHQQHSFREQWLKYERQEVEDDYHVRNKQMHQRVKEVQRVLALLDSMNEGKEINNIIVGVHFDTTQLKGLLDMDQVGIVGHSFGGATTIATLAKDKRFKVGVALDSWMLPIEKSLYQKVTQPVLLVNTESFQWKSNVRDMYRLDVNGDRKDRILLTIRGTCHQSQTDFQFMVHGTVAKFLEMRHTLEPQIAMDLNNRATRGFLWKHLGVPNKDHHEDVLTGHHHEIIMGTNLNLAEPDDKPPY